MTVASATVSAPASTIVAMKSRSFSIGRCPVLATALGSILLLDQYMDMTNKQTVSAEGGRLRLRPLRPIACGGSSGRFYNGHPVQWPSGGIPAFAHVNRQ